MLLRLTIIASLALGAAACNKATRSAGPPSPFTIKQWEQNPDVIWVVRAISADRGAKRNIFRPKAEQVGMAHYGLFACYRSEEPGPPACFLAETIGSKEQIVWPDNPKMYKGWQ